MRKLKVVPITGSKLDAQIFNLSLIPDNEGSLTFNDCNCVELIASDLAHSWSRIGLRSAGEFQYACGANHQIQERNGEIITMFKLEDVKHSPLTRDPLQLECASIHMNLVISGEIR